jgi:hypothetical protein
MQDLLEIIQPLHLHSFSQSYSQLPPQAVYAPSKCSIVQRRAVLPSLEQTSLLPAFSGGTQVRILIGHFP